MSEVTKKVTPPQARCGSSGGHLIYVKKGLVGAFIQEKALMGAISMIVKTDCETDESSAARLLPHPQKLYSRVLHSTAKQMQSAIYFLEYLKPANIQALNQQFTCACEVKCSNVEMQP